MCNTMRAAIKRARELTMACWWPSKVMGRTVTDWHGVYGELRASSQAEVARGDYARATEINGVLAVLQLGH